MRAAFGDALAGFNALMNGSAAVLLFAGYWAVRTRRLELHRRLMLSAFCASCIFLAGYLTRFALTGVHRFPLEGGVKTAYLVILGTHTVLAAAALPLILRTLWLSLVRKRFDAHRRIARWTFPVWGYVSVTGVVVYLMLYHLPGWVGAAGG